MLPGYRTPFASMLLTPPPSQAKEPENADARSWISWSIASDNSPLCSGWSGSTGAIFTNLCGSCTGKERNSNALITPKIAVDRSGSMNGTRLAAAAPVAAACALRAPQEHAVLSFAASVDLIRPLASEIVPAVVAERLLRLRGHGVTRLSAALTAAGEQLAHARARRRVVILLSDCRSTDDDDTLEVARTLPELIILAPADDHEQDAQLADLAGARWAALADPLDAAAVLDYLLEARITA